MIERGGIHWVDLGGPVGSGPATRRPVLVVQAQPFNDSRLSTVLALVVTSNTGLATMPGNVFLAASASGLPKDSTVNVTAVVRVDKGELGELVRVLSPYLLEEVDRGLRLVLGL